MIKDGIGLVHLIASVVALVLGTAILVINKGSRAHKKYGYGYCLAMIITLVTSFFIYRLYGRFGVFHYLAVVSGFTLLRGMLPMLMNRSGADSLNQHFRSMYWSVVGLYAAFAAELLVRVPFLYHLFSGILPRNLFHYLALFASLAVILVSLIAFLKKKAKWLKLVQGFKTQKH